MKKAKNILLIVGIALYGLANLLNVALVIYNSSVFVSAAGLRYVFNSVLYMLILQCAVGVCPVLLLVKNLRRKVSKVLPILTIVITALMMVVSWVSSLANPIPQYLIMSSVGVIDTYGTLLFHYLGNGGLCYLLGGGCVIAGCIVTLCENKVKGE